MNNLIGMIIAGKIDGESVTLEVIGTEVDGETVKIITKKLELSDDD